MNNSLLIAGTSTLLFWLLTFKTGYPYLVEDYLITWKSYLPSFSLHDFLFLFAQRPLPSFINYLFYKFHIFEKTKLPFFFYFFLHSLGVIWIFRYFLYRFTFPSKHSAKSSSPVGQYYFQNWSTRTKGQDGPTAGRVGHGCPSNSGNNIAPLDCSRSLFWITITLCLYPCWFEINLMALNLPYGLGTSFLALLLFQKNNYLRFFLLLLSFTCLETYILPALALLLLDSYFEHPHSQEHNSEKHKTWKAYGVNTALWGLALLTYLALEKGLSFYFTPPTYKFGLTLQNILSQMALYTQLLWFQSFYKVNWISTILELSVVFGISAYLLKNKKSRLLIFLLFTVPLFSTAHSFLMVYYAPRAIHGAMVLKAVLIGVLLVEFLYTYPKKYLPQLAVLALFSAYVGHYGIVVSHRSYNHALMNTREAQITQELLQCQSPCTIDARHLSSDLKGDWYINYSFRDAFVMCIKERNGIKKEVNILL